MGVIAIPNTFSANTTISSSEVNSNFSTIYNEFNGSITAANLATGAVTTAKIAAGAVTTTELGADAVTTAKIAADTITGADINWSGTGADSGIWWEELGRTTLGVAGDTITVSNLPARKYLKIITAFTATGGTAAATIKFNNDGAANYAHRFSDGGAADTLQVSQTALIFRAASAPTGGNQYVEAEFSNIATVEKNGKFTGAGTVAAIGAGTAPARVEGALKWANTADQISRIDVVNIGTGDFAIGSECVALGHN